MIRNLFLFFTFVGTMALVSPGSAKADDVTIPVSLEAAVVEGGELAPLKLDEDWAVELLLVDMTTRKDL